MTKLVLSGPFDYKGKGWGYAHYSYGFALDSFKTILDQNEDKILDTFYYPFLTPEIKSRTQKFSNLVHISFLPPDVALLVPKAFNICVFAWEFDKLPKQSKEKNGTFKKDYPTALKNFNAVIVLSSYTQRVLESYGINSYVLPSSVIKKTIEPQESIDDLKCYPLTTETNAYEKNIANTFGEIAKNSPYSKRFLYILNPHDIRKNFGNLVTAFDKFVIDHPDATLFLKITAQGELTKLQQIAFAREFPSFPETRFRNVYFIPEKLSDSKLQLLLESCEFYVSPSRAEGQNLPLCEAMVSERICIAPDHTSMQDFVDPESSIVLEYNSWIIDESTHKYSDFWGFSWYNVGEETILNSLHKAIDLTNEEKQGMIVKAKQNIETFCSQEAVSKKWNEIKNNLKIAL